MKVVPSGNLIEKVTERFIKLQLIESPTSELFLRTLIGRKIVSFDTMRQYGIIKDFELYLRINKGKIQDALYDLEDDYGLSSRQIRRILKEYRCYS
jgi:hypothetical protein